VKKESVGKADPAPLGWVQLLLFPPELYGGGVWDGTLPNTTNGAERARKVAKARRDRVIHREEINK
jgi:hypothetical protein